jgi:hypothetical protein
MHVQCACFVMAGRRPNFEKSSYRLAVARKYF